MRIALVHDALWSLGGAERVFLRLAELWPDAPIYAIGASRSFCATYLPGRDIRTSWLSALPGAQRIWPALAPAMPAAVEWIDLASYDAVVSSSVAFSKGIITRPQTRHVSICYSPTRWLWDRAHAYERSGIASRLFQHTLRVWDRSAAQRPDEVIAISETVAGRIRAYYGRTAHVIYPPAPLIFQGKSAPSGPRSGFLVVARLMPHKNLDILLSAFAKIREPLTIIGDGPLRAKLLRNASSNVRILGWQSDADTRRAYASANAVIVPNEEDFGFTAVEAMTHGTPVLALRAGGCRETICEGVTGEFFDDPIPEALADGVRRIRQNIPHYDAYAIMQQGVRYSGSDFAKRLRDIVEDSE